MTPVESRIDLTPVEKANELVNKMFNCDKFTDETDMAMLYPHALQCALIAVNEMIEYENRMLEEWTRYFEGKGGQMKIERLFWEEVKQEIEYMKLKNLPK